MGNEEEKDKDKMEGGGGEETNLDLINSENTSGTRGSRLHQTFSFIGRWVRIILILPLRHEGVLECFGLTRVFEACCKLFGFWESKPCDGGE